MREIFVDMDTDKSGTITVEEFAEALKKKGRSIPRAELEEILEVRACGRAEANRVVGLGGEQGCARVPGALWWRFERPECHVGLSLELREPYTYGIVCQACVHVVFLTLPRPTPLHPVRRCSTPLQGSVSLTPHCQSAAVASATNS